LIPFCKKSSKRREKRNKFIEKEPRSGALTKRVTRLKRVCKITKTIFDIRDLGNGCKEEKIWEHIPSRMGPPNSQVGDN